MLKVLNQPFDGALGYILENKLGDHTEDRCDIFYFLVAYARKSGVGRLSPFMKKFREQGGIIKAVVGIDQKNTSLEALLELWTLCNELYIFHNEDFSRTYHPKMYFFNLKNKSAWVSIGSSNLTGGGLYGNYEINAFYDFKLENHNDTLKCNELLSVFSHYIDLETGCSVLADEKLLKSLFENNYIRNEQQIRQTFVQRLRTDIEEKPKKIFSKQVFPEPPTKIVTSSEDPRINETHGINVGFWKKLSANDVSLTSSPGQIIIPLQFLNFFPPFGDPILTPKGGEQNDVFFNVVFKSSSNKLIKIDNARVIFYTPAPWHPRPNSELRFTFRNQKILTQLKRGDILEFQRSDSPSIWFFIRQIKSSNTDYLNYNGNFSHF